MLVQVINTYTNHIAQAWIVSLALFEHLVLLKYLEMSKYCSWLWLTFPLRVSVQQRLALAEVGQAVQSVILGTVEPCDEFSLIHQRRLGLTDLLIGVFVLLNERGPTFFALEASTNDRFPLADVPHRARDLAALGHLNAVERVAVAAEQARNEESTTAELATLVVKLLPPILVVAVSSTHLLCSQWSTLLGKPRTDPVVKVVQSIAQPITPKANQKVVLLAEGPAPRVHRARPVSNVDAIPLAFRAQATVSLSDSMCLLRVIVLGLINCTCTGTESRLH